MPINILLQSCNFCTSDLNGVARNGIAGLLMVIFHPIAIVQYLDVMLMSFLEKTDWELLKKQ